MTLPGTNPCSTLENGQVHLWWIDLDSLRLIDDPASVLTGEECKRARRFRLDLDRERWVRARASVRMILASYLSILPSEIVFSYAQKGKPEIPNQSERRNLHFNLSHSGRMCGLALTHVDHIGIDVEEVRNVPEAMEIAKTRFTDSQYLHLLDAPPDQRIRVFLRFWTETEACLKAQGLGLGHDDSRTPLIENREGNVNSISELPWQNFTADPDASHCGSIVLRAATRPLLLTFWATAFRKTP